MNSSYSLKVSAPPHSKLFGSISAIMLSVIISLLPALVWSCVRLGLRSLFVCLVCVFSSILFEFVYQMIFKRKTTVHDLSALVTGMLIAFNMPVAVPIYIPIVACFFAVIVVKQLFGGIGKNYVNPAAAAVVLVTGIWKTQMSPSFVGSKWLVNLDNIEFLSPLTHLKMGEIPSESFFDLFFGNANGTIGAISAAMLIVGALYLFWSKVITWHIPVTYLAVSAALFYLTAPQGIEIASLVSCLCAGSLVLGAFFMATDYTTTPMTARGKIAFGVGCALLTVVFRKYTGITQDVAVSILIMNALSRPIDHLLRPKFFGYKRKNNR